MILQLLVKGDAVGFKRYAATGQDIEEVVCVNPVSVKVKYAQGELIEATQHAEDSGSASDPIDLPVDQVIHLKWDAPGFSPRGNSLVLPAFQAIELLRDYRRAEQAPCNNDNSLRFLVTAARKYGEIRQKRRRDTNPVV